MLFRSPALDALARIEAGSVAPDDFDAVAGRWDIRQQLQAELEGSGLGHLHADISAEMLSGGEAMRIALIGAMLAGLAAGGEEGPVHSAGLVIVREVAWPVADLRVDWHDDDPVGALAELWERWKPQLDAYVTRAIDPTKAPSYGVPGNKGFLGAKRVR